MLDAGGKVAVPAIPAARANFASAEEAVALALEWELTVTKQITANPKMRVDGKEELHDALKTKNDAEIKNAVAYILSR